MLEDCFLPITGTTGGPALLGLALLLIVGGLTLWAATRRKRKNAALVLVIPSLLGALLLSGTPAPAYATNSDDCRRSTPAATPHADASPGVAPTSTPTTSPGVVDDYDTDTDGDRLPDSVEVRFGSDPLKVDTDGDGLTDGEEATVGTDPTKVDSDDNGILDPADDLDQDGVINRQELTDGTQPFSADTDIDGLTDGDEKTRTTNPISNDTDADGVVDGDEVRVGSNPLVADADQIFTLGIAPADVPASLDASGTPAALAETTVSVAPEALFEGVAGLIGTPIIVDAGDGITSGTLTLSFDASTVPAGAQLAVMHLNEDTGAYDQPSDQTIDLATGTATVTTNAFSPFIVVDVAQFNEIWKNEIVVPRDGSGGTTQWLNAALAIDSSGSMGDNDPNDLRKDAAKSFVDSLLSQDQAAVVDFDDRARVTQSLTVDRAAVKAAIDTVDSSGGTDIGAAVRTSLDELNTDPDASKGRVIVLLTDGDGSYSESLTAEAAASKTTIYTVGLGASTNQPLLDRIATTTGGKFFLVENADGLNDAYERIGSDLGKPDSDSDGLSDEAETTGWRTQRGNVYKTDPNNADTDGDSLSDGLEAGRLISTKTGYEGISSPTTRNTDSDGVEDGDEYYLGLNALIPDTDGDRLRDNVELDFESDPTDRDPDGDHLDDGVEFDRNLDPLAYDLGSDAERWQVMWAGFLWGEYTDRAKQFHGLQDAQVQSTTYLVGWTASGTVLFGDLRDLYKNVMDGDSLSALLNVAALVPLYGDAAKLGVQLTKFAKAGGHAAKSAGRYIDALPLPLSARKSLQQQVFGAGARVFPQALEGGPAVTHVYLRRNIATGEVDYVGITKNIDRRRYEHGFKNKANYELVELTNPASPLTRGRARAIEQAVIDLKGGVKSKGGLFENNRNSISASHAYRNEAKDWGTQWLHDNLSQSAKELLGL